jgi:hypothetical protein
VTQIARASCSKKFEEHELFPFGSAHPKEARFSRFQGTKLPVY